MKTKNFNLMHNVGQAKYVINFHDSIKQHKDGSPFYDIRLFSNKNKFNQSIKELLSDGYTQTN